MATIKEQTEKTERLKTSLDSKVIAIADEIKKQDNIDITRLSEVPDAIAQLKNSRKRWASGTARGHALGVAQNSRLELNLPKMDFTPFLVYFFIPKGSAPWSDSLVGCTVKLEGTTLYSPTVGSVSYTTGGTFNGIKSFSAIKYNNYMDKLILYRISTSFNNQKPVDNYIDIPWIAFE